MNRGSLWRLVDHAFHNYKSHGWLVSHVMRKLVQVIQRLVFYEGQSKAGGAERNNVKVK